MHDKAKLQELVVGFDPIVLPTPWQRWRRHASGRERRCEVASRVGIVGRRSHECIGLWYLLPSKANQI